MFLNNLQDVGRIEISCWTMVLVLIFVDDRVDSFTDRVIRFVFPNIPPKTTWKVWPHRCSFFIFIDFGGPIVWSEVPTFDPAPRRLNSIQSWIRSDRSFPSKVDDFLKNSANPARPIVTDR